MAHEVLVEAVRFGRVVRIDAARANGSLFLLMAGVGAVAGVLGTSLDVTERLTDTTSPLSVVRIESVSSAFVSARTSSALEMASPTKNDAGTAWSTPTRGWSC